MALKDNHALQLAAGFISQTGRHVFLTGKAGTGKTTFLRNLKSITFKRHIVVAPTGVAAINAGGVTIHSFFQLPFGPQIPEDIAYRLSLTNQDARHSASRFQRFNRSKINIIKSIDLLVIDEISMVRADLLDAIDSVLRRYRNRDKPFGGVQLLMIGDLQQLAPIAREEEWSLLKDYYDSVYFFSSKALQRTNYVSIELTDVYRQKDEVFINLLGKIRENKLDSEAMAMLEKRFIPNFQPKDEDGYITLTTHNYQAQEINQLRLNQLNGKTFSFEAKVTGDFPEYNYPTDETLKLKIGAQVMFLKNDPSPLKLFYNGKIGKLVEIDEEILFVQCPDEPDPIAVTPLEWHHCKYSLDEETKEISENIIGSFQQYPLKLAWAVTIHKSQGLTFEKAIIDARQAFAHGQVYVALSRCRTLEGMVLSSGITGDALKTDFTVGTFIRKLQEKQPNQNQLIEAKNEYQMLLVFELFDFKGLQRRLSYLLKVLRDKTSSVDTNTIQKFAELEQFLKTEIYQIAEKFVVQVNNHLKLNPDIEQNASLQERIMKGSTYFASKIETGVIPEIPEVESDNKAVRKNIEELLEVIVHEVEVKLACLKQCAGGFTVSGYLETHARASIETSKTKKKPAKQEFAGGKVSHPELLNKLRQWRDTLAEEMDIPIYRILPRKAMLTIADNLPANQKELIEVKGMGKKKVSMFGNDILNIIQNHMKEHNIEKAISFAPLPVEKKENKPDSKRLSFEIFSSGKSIAEVAQERGFAASTIEGHLAWFIGTGELPVEKLLEPEKLARINSYFGNTTDHALSLANTALGDDVSWSELRYVQKYNEFLRKSKTED